MNRRLRQDLQKRLIVENALRESEENLDITLNSIGDAVIATDAKGLVMTEILNVLAQDDAGLDVDGTWDPATGIYTLGTVTTGIHNLTVIGY